MSSGTKGGLSSDFQESIGFKNKKNNADDGVSADAYHIIKTKSKSR